MNICILGDAQSVHVQRLASGLARRAMGVHVVTHRPCEIPDATVERFKVPPLSLSNGRRWQGRREQALRGLFQRYDVVHMHFLRDWGLTPEIACTGSFVVTPWGSDIVPPPGEAHATAAQKENFRMLLQCAAHVTAWGPRFARRIADFAGVDLREIALLPLGVDLSQFAINKSAEPGGAPIVGFFKGFREVYGAEYLIRAVPLILRQVPEAQICMIGEGPRLEECRRLAEKLNVDRVIEWLPRQPHRELPNHIGRWKVSVIPSVSESFGAAALESSAMMVPVVASEVGGLPDAVRHGVTGLLVSPCDPVSLADGVTSLLRNEALRLRMGRAGREFVAEHYEWNGILDRWVETYAAARDRSAVMV